MTEDERREIEFVLASLRHLYQNLVKGWTQAQPRNVADGLLSPQIRRLEKLVERKVK